MSKATDTKVLVEFEHGSYTLSVIANSPEAGRRKIAKAIKDSAYPRNEWASDIDNYKITPLSDLEIVNWS